MKKSVFVYAGVPAYTNTLTHTVSVCEGGEEARGEQKKRGEERDGLGGAPLST